MFEQVGLDRLRKALEAEEVRKQHQQQDTDAPQAKEGTYVSYNTLSR